MVTPTLRLVKRLKRDDTNRILRRFIELGCSDFLLRVAFVSDLGEKDHYSEKPQLLKQQIVAKLESGFNIVNVRFLRLAQSSSQFKIRSFWFLGEGIRDPESVINEQATFAE